MPLDVHFAGCFRQVAQVQIDVPFPRFIRSGLGLDVSEGDRDCFAGIGGAPDWRLGRALKDHIIAEDCRELNVGTQVDLSRSKSGQGGQFNQGMFFFHARGACDFMTTVFLSYG